MKKFMCTAAVVAFSLYATAQEKADSAKIDILLLPNVELNEVNVLGTWAQKNDPIAQINLTQKDIEALNAELSDPRFADSWWQDQINMMLELGKKAEQQSLAKYGLDFVTETYLPEKLAELGLA